ncbi:uncharacterized protein LOC143889371 [Tasmannia lanceolata]|uniref:uncharacterized protein LOC143889371 n=1 Tax=Tasmannia lanceolata TaxID=3420 RepID=UPI004062A44E
MKYSICVVADKGLKKPLYTSARLKKGEVLYLETHSNRYELCFNGEKVVSNGTMPTSQEADSTDHEHIIDVFRWSRCKKPLPQKAMLSIGVPLPVEHLEALADNLDWEDIEWAQGGVVIGGNKYRLERVNFLSSI